MVKLVRGQCVRCPAEDAIAFRGNLLFCKSLFCKPLAHHQPTSPLHCNTIKSRVLSTATKKYIYINN